MFACEEGSGTTLGSGWWLAPLTPMRVAAKGKAIQMKARLMRHCRRVFPGEPQKSRTPDIETWKMRTRHRRLWRNWTKLLHLQRSRCVRSMSLSVLPGGSALDHRCGCGRGTEAFLQ